MSLKAVVSKEDLEGLKPDLQAEYVEKDGMFHLDVESSTVGKAVFSLEDVSGLKSSLSKERQRAEEYKGKLGDIGDLDIVAARDALNKVKEMADWTPEQKVREQIDAIKNQLTQKHDKDRKAWNDEKGFLSKQVEKLLIDSVATQILSSEKHKGNAKLLLPHIRNQVRVTRGENGDFVTQVIGDDGNVLLSPKSGSTAPMTIEELIEGMKGDSEFAPAFAGSGASGSGAGSSTRAGSHGIRRLTREEASDPRQYQKLSEACSKAGVNILDYLPE